MLYADDRVYAQYFKDVSRVPMPADAAEERELIRRYRDRGDQKARQKLISGNLRFVIKTANQYSRGNLEFLKSLIAAGNIGLTLAVDRYMPWVIPCQRCQHKNYVPVPKRQRCQRCNRALRYADAEQYTTRFLTYAAWWISEAIRTQLYRSSLVHIPPYKQKEFHRARQEGKECPGPSYIAYDDLAHEPPAVDFDEHITNLDARRILYRALREMRDRHSYVVITYYGLREEPKTLNEIAQKLGVCSERVRQIKVDALEDLRRRLFRFNVHQTGDVYQN